MEAGHVMKRGNNSLRHVSLLIIQRMVDTFMCTPPCSCRLQGALSITSCPQTLSFIVDGRMSTVSSCLHSSHPCSNDARCAFVHVYACERLSQTYVVHASCLMSQLSMRVAM